MNNSLFLQRTLKKKLPIFLINTLLLHIHLLALTHRQNDRWRNKYTGCTWAGGLFFQLCCCVSFWFWREIGFGATYLCTSSTIQMWCCVSFLVLAGNIFGVTYILSVQYSCTVVSVFWLWREIVLKKWEHLLISYEQFLQKNHIGLLYYDPIANVYIS